MASANASVREVTEKVARLGNWTLVETAFLEGSPPTLAETVGSLIGRGATQILVVPYFLTLGLHLQRDLPRIVEELRVAHPGTDIRVTPPLDGHPALHEVLLDRVRTALE